MKVRWLTLELAVATAVLLVFGTALIAMTLGEEDGRGAYETGPVGRAILLSCYVVSCGLALAYYRVLEAACLRAPALLLLIVFPFVTLLWSVMPDETLRRSAGIVCPSLLGLYLGWRLPLRQLVLYFALVSFVLAVGNLAAVLLVPQIGITTEPPWIGAWKGLQSHKNSLGSSASFGALALIAASMALRGHLRLLALGGVAIQFLLLAFSQSLTGVLTVALGMATLLVLLRAHRPRTYYAVGASAALCMIVMAGFVLQYGAGPIMEEMGKSDTLSDRLPLWTEVMPSIATQPWLGYGYAAFWESKLPDPDRIATNVLFTPHYSHNGLLEMMLDGGAFLVALFISVFVPAVVRAARLAAGGRAEFAFPLMFYAAFVLGNFTEALVLARNSLISVEFVALTFALTLRARHEAAWHPVEMSSSAAPARQA